MNLFLNEDTYDGYRKYQKDLAKRIASGFAQDEYGNVEPPKPAKKRAALDEVNPYLPDSSFLEAQETAKPNVITSSSNPLTLAGTLIKALFLIGIITISLFAIIFICNNNEAIFDNGVKIFIFSALVSIIIAFAMGTRHSSAPGLSLLYSILFGTSLGLFFIWLETTGFGSIVTYAIISAMGIEVICIILRLYGAKLSLNSYTTLSSALIAGIFPCYLFAGILHLSDINVTMLHETHFAAWALVFLNIFTVTNSLQGETAVIEYAAEKRAPKYEEWFCAFGLSFTIIWSLVSTAIEMMKSMNDEED